MMPMPTRRKTRDMEKVENLCRTATAWKILPARRNKPDHACAIRCAPKGWRAASLTREEGDGERGHDQIVVEHAARPAAGTRGAVSHRPDRPCQK